MKGTLTAKAAFIVMLLLIFAKSPNAQVTTATLSGIVKDSKGAALGSATITVEFPDAGISQSLITKPDGRFTVSNLRVGGPYRG
ncbi:MAG TPA: carboxypeptidase-like regulatory domain-containing protein, partial [Chitinophagaceae bacterium]|nr:carboxypeptidase-like regulatory domain-containing protein [Chitinophagaceae bacterium]